jgi:23S rRNA (adenine2503-C2)-methyltransferase
MGSCINTMNYDLVKTYLSKIGEPDFRLKQLRAAILHGAEDWADVKGWSKALIESASSKFEFLSYQNSEIYLSKDDTRKAALKLKDGSVIETVLMEPIPGTLSVCVSCEVGCPMNCSFCATGRMGFKRVLTTEEITDQWLFWKSYNPSHLVFMGMGEPLHNQANVFQAIHNLHDFYGVGWRKMSLSTSGITPGIEAFGLEFPQMNLAISLHAGTDPLRTQLMPINKTYSLEMLKEAIINYLKLTPRQVMFEYLLIKGVNDHEEAFSALLSWLKNFPKRLIHINLIRYNPTGIFEAPETETVSKWKHQLNDLKISCSIRKNLGVDIMGACGQLATNRISE